MMCMLIEMFHVSILASNGILFGGTYTTEFFPLIIKEVQIYFVS